MKQAKIQICLFIVLLAGLTGCGSTAKKARDLVGVDDEDHRPTIHDLQSTVDVTQAFHEPVYPRPRDQQGGEK